MSVAAEAGARLRWYVNRLRCMSPAEVGHRALRAFAGARRRVPRPEAVPAPDLALTVPVWHEPPAGVDPAPYLAAADRIVAGRYDLFALRGLDLGAPPRWNRDPKTGLEVPLAAGARIDHRDESRVGDIKYLWELNRHLHLVTLAQAHALSGEARGALGGKARYAAALREQLESWFDACPCPLGPNWASALEAGLRLISWAHAWQLLGGARAPLIAGAGGESFRRRWLASVFQHAHFVRANLSRYSSANNHLLGEAAGLYVAALTWPCWPQARAWRDEARALLERETLRQNGADGVNREQAVCYQRFVLELLLVAGRAAAANGSPLAPEVLRRIEAMCEYLVSIMDAGGNVPMLGDADDGAVLPPEPARSPNDCRAALAAAATLLHREDFARQAGAAPARREFPEGGYYLLGSDFGTREEIRLLADAGPLGYLAIAAHGHADALAFTLSVGGLEFLVDPGTYAYHTQKRWRDYFRGTGAHNTVRIDGRDQSEPGGNFMWLRKARAACSRWSSSERLDSFEGWHDGYLRLPDPVLHRRRILLHKSARRVQIDDVLEMSGTHEVELFFHCSERCRVAPSARGYTLAQGGRTLRLRLPHAEGADWQVYRGSDAPIGGWVSRGYDRKEPADTIAWRARLAGPALLRTEICC